MFELIGRAKAAGQVAFTWPSLTPLPGTTSFNQTLDWLLNGVLIIAGAIAVLYLIYGGLTYITAGGDAEKATKGRTVIINAIIGIVIIALAFVIVTWVTNIIRTGRTG